MKVLGLIVEYNPLHNGHLYHIENSKKLTGADTTVCIMSGNYIQRGEPAIINKWARAKSALLCGVDLVLELPHVYAVSSAEYFAHGAIKILDSLNSVDCVCFGSELGTISHLDAISSILLEEPQLYKAALKGFLKKGLSFPASRESALIDYTQNHLNLGTDIKKVLSLSNNILGIEYLKALKKLKSTIIPYTIERKGGLYNSSAITDSFSSATAIRKLVLDDFKIHYTTIKKNMPDSSFSILEEEIENGRGPISSENFENILLNHLRSFNIDRIKELPYVSEGLENRIKKAALNSTSYSQLIDNISTKRYPTTRIQRSLIHCLSGLTRTDFNEFNNFGGPNYAKILGFNSNGQKLLSQIVKKTQIPVISKAASLKKSCNPLVTKMLDIENISTDAYVLGYPNKDFKKGGQEFTQNIIKV